MTDTSQMALFIAVFVLMWAILLVFIGPKVTRVSRRNWAMIMMTLIILWIPMGCYLIFFVGSSNDINPRHVARIGLLNLLVGVPLFIFIVRKWILQKTK